MNYRPTILNVTTAIFLVGCLIMTIKDYNALSKDEGWGVVAMIVLILIGLFALFVDFVFQSFIKNRLILNGLEFIIIIAIAYMIIISS
jgi:hypothetical protein